MKIKTQLSYNFLLWFFIFVYVFCFSWVCVRKFFAFGYYDFDLAIHDLTVWNILHGSIFNSILGIPFLGNHMHVVLFLIAPFYAIFNHPIFLLILQTLLLGLTAVPLFKLASKLLDKNWALIVIIGYLLYPALGYTNLFEFHPTVFATFFLTLAFYFYENSSFAQFIIFALLAMLSQENIPLAVIMFGVLALIERRSFKWSVLPIIIGLFYLFIALKLISYFNHDTVQFINIYSHWGRTPKEIVLNILRRPDLLFLNLFRPPTIRYLYQIFLPVFFLPCLGIYGLFVALPFFMQHILSNRISEQTIFYHYTAEMIPFIFIGYIYGIKLLLRYPWVKLNQRIFKMFLLFIICLSNLLLGPHWMLPKLISGYKKDFFDQQKETLLAKIPKAASIVATFEFLPYLTHRRNLYSFHHVYSGFYTLSQKRYKLPPEVDYALIDINDFLTFRGFYHPDNYINNQEFFLNSKWALLELKNNLILLKKQKTAKFELCQNMKELSPENFYELDFIIDESIKLLGYNLIDLGQNREGYEIILYWESLKHTDKDINIFLDLVNDSDILIWRIIHPICYRIYPTYSWQAGERFREKINFIIPSPLNQGRYKIKIGFFNYRNNMLLNVRGDMDSLGRVILGQIK